MCMFENTTVKSHLPDFQANPVPIIRVWKDVLQELQEFTYISCTGLLLLVK